MQTDHDEIRAHLKDLKATLEHPMRLMHRTLLDYPDHRLQKNNWGRLRVRDEGDKVTITYKSGSDHEYSKEIETTVGSYDTMIALLEAIGLQTITLQESKRETWQVGTVEVVLDIWPWLTPYIEIEGPSEQAIQQCAADLELNWKDAAFGNVDTAYRVDYPRMGASETIGAIASLTFDGPLPGWLKERQ